MHLGPEVDDVLYSQRSVSEMFSDGCRSLSETLKELNMGRVDPLKHNNFKLLVADWFYRGHG